MRTMFTGLVEAVGTLARRTPASGGARLSVACKFHDLVLGESVAVDGACLTVVHISSTGFDADASSETLTRTTLGSLAIGAPVNLERAMLAGGRFGGHMVSGHIDGEGRVLTLEPLGNAVRWRFRMPANLARFVAEKGSITISGISLTVNDVDADTFSVAIIPHTLANTSLRNLAIGSRVNLEVDLVARYLARMLDVDKASHSNSSLEHALQRAGYT